MSAPARDLAAGLTVADCRPEVLAFALLMEAKLRLNDHKGGWKDMEAETLAVRVREEAAELHAAVIRAERGGWSPATQRVMEENVASETADVANFAMMVADVGGFLSRARAGAAS